MVEMTWFGQRLFDHTHSLFSGVILWVFCYPEDTILPLFLFEVLKLVAILACLVLNCRVNFWKVLTTLVCIQVRVTGNIFYSFQKYFKLKCRKSFSHHTHCLGAVGSPWNKLSIRMAFCWEKKPSHLLCCVLTCLYTSCWIILVCVSCWKCISVFLLCSVVTLPVRTGKKSVPLQWLLQQGQTKVVFVVVDCFVLFCFVLHTGTFVLSDPSLKELFFSIYSHNYFL